MKTTTFTVVYENKSGDVKTERLDAVTAQHAVDLIRKWEGNSVFIRMVSKEVRNWK